MPPIAGVAVPLLPIKAKSQHVVSTGKSELGPPDLDFMWRIRVLPIAVKRQAVRRSERCLSARQDSVGLTSWLRQRTASTYDQVTHRLPYPHHGVDCSLQRFQVPELGPILRICPTMPKYVFDEVGSARYCLRTVKALQLPVQRLGHG